jgi:hypothetical protein
LNWLISEKKQNFFSWIFNLQIFLKYTKRMNLLEDLDFVLYHSKTSLMWTPLRLFTSVHYRVDACLVVEWTEAFKTSASTLSKIKLRFSTFTLYVIIIQHFSWKVFELIHEIIIYTMPSLVMHKRQTMKNSERLKTHRLRVYIREITITIGSTEKYSLLRIPRCS